MPNLDDKISKAGAGRLLGMSDVAAILSKFRMNTPCVTRPAQLWEGLRLLGNTYFADDLNFPMVVQLLDFLFNDGAFDLAAARLNERDFLYARNLMCLKPVIASAGRLRPTRRFISKTDQSEDALADNANEWSVWRVLNLAMMMSMPPRKKVAIVTSVRNEGLGILEWLAHHRACGFEDFFVYTNNNNDGSDKLLQGLAEFGIINLIDNEVGGAVKIQTKILEHSLHLLPELRDFEWVFYIDVDEFFISRCEPGLTLDSFFDAFKVACPIDLPSAVCFNWKWFGSENAYEMTDGLLLERFVYSIHNEHVKSLVKLADVLSMCRVHVPVLVENKFVVNSEFQRSDAEQHMKPAYGAGQLNHYWNKSFQEFVLKRSRGRISRTLTSAPLEFQSFFDWGANGRRGNYDPPNDLVLERTKREYMELLEIFDVKNILSEIGTRCKLAIAELDRELGIDLIYKNRGRTD